MNVTWLVKMCFALAGPFLSMGAIARVEEAVAPGPLLEAIKVTPMSGQVDCGVSVKLKASADERATPAVSPMFEFGSPMFDIASLFPTASSYEQTPADIYEEDLSGEVVSPVDAFSTFPSTFASTDLRTKPNGGSLSPSRRDIVTGFADENPNSASAPSKVAMQTILVACGLLATGSTTTGAAFGLLGGATVDAAKADTAKERTDKTCDDEATCGTEAKASKRLFLWGLVTTTWMMICSTYAVFLKLKEMDETFQYVRRHALTFWQSLSGLVDFMRNLNLRIQQVP